MFVINGANEIEPQLLSRLLSAFSSRESPLLDHRYQYYRGMQRILLKPRIDADRPCNRIVTNYCNNIVKNYLGYLVGRPISYTSESDMKEIQATLDYNDSDAEDRDFLENALVYGTAYEINYIDEDGKQRFKVLDPRHTFPIYDDTVTQNLLAVVRYYQRDPLDRNSGFVIELIGPHDTKTYYSDSTYDSLTVAREQPHYFGQVPVTVFDLNNERESIFEQIIPLQDAYNTTLSANVDNFEAFCDAYMVLTGVQADSQDLAQMKKDRVILLDADSTASYLVKNTTDAVVEGMLKRINDDIHKIANSPDFNDEKFMSTSGIAMRYKLTGFENTASSIVANMTKALQKRIELICAILYTKGSETIWRDIQISFSRNLPVNTLEAAQEVNALRGLVSDKTLLSRLPFVDDPQKEIESRAEQDKQEYSLRPAQAGDVIE